MKPRCSNQRNQALTLIEALVVIAVLAALVAIILPALARAKVHGGPNCASNLKEIGLAYRVWAGDNGDKYPMEISVTNGGTMGLADGQNAWINYFVMSNELSTPRILHCPKDVNGFSATNFSSGFNNQNVSYFVGLDASVKFPQALLSGDDNFEVGGIPVKPGLLKIAETTSIAWTAARHNHCGNTLLADGSVQQLINSGLTNLLRQTGVATNRLAIP